MTDAAGAALEAVAFEALLAHRAGVVVLVVDERLRILRAGAQAAALADRDEGELGGMSLIAAFGSADLDAICREVTATGAATTGEATLGRGRERTFAVDAVPMAVVDGPPVIVVALHDVTALRRVERVRRDFVANISHELRTPLASIKLLAETLSAGAVDDPATARDFTAQIERETDHLAQLVDELLDLSMIESGETVLNVEALDPDRVLDDTAERIRPVAQRRGVAVGRQPARQGSMLRAVADAARLGQALLNLAHNAVKYSHPGETVRLGWQPVGDRIRFTVSDDGIGIPTAHQQRIFERFYKVDRARTTERSVMPDDGAALGGSAGLGLAIVRHIAEAHGGAVGLTSEEGAGSTFWIEVPLAEGTS